MNEVIAQIRARHEMRARCAELMGGYTGPTASCLTSMERDIQVLLKRVDELEAAD